MWEAPSLPWAMLRYLEQQKEKITKFLFPVSILTLVLIFDYFYIQPTPESFFSEKLLALITILCLLATTYGVYLYLDCELKMQKLRNNDLATEQKRRNIEKSRELLKKAGITSAQKTGKVFSIPDMYKPSYPYQRGYDSLPTEITPSLKLNLRPFDTSDDLAEEFMKSLGIDKQMKRWIQNIRLWFSKQFLPLILENYSTNLTRLNALVREYTQGKERPWIYSGTFDDESYQFSYDETMYYKRVSIKEIQDLAIEIGCNYAQDIEITRSFSFRGQNPVETQKANQRVNFIDILKQRMIFEKYTELPGFNCRAYVLQRMRALARSTCLSAYSSTSGGFYNSDSWTPKRPTDSHILSHLFFCLLNNGNNPSFNPEINFMSEILISYPSSIPHSDQSSKAWFYQKNPESSIEPHFDIVSGGEIWQAYKGNDNLFSAIALFLYHVKVKSQGMFMQMNCSELLELIA